MAGPTALETRYVNENDQETVTVTTNRDTTGLTVTYYLQHPSGSTTAIGTASGVAVSTPFNITLDYDVDNLGADEYYRVIIIASDGATETTLWPDSTQSNEAEQYVFVRDIPTVT